MIYFINSWPKTPANPFFQGVLGNKLMKYIIFRYRNITKPIKNKAKSEFREDYNTSLMISKLSKIIEDAIQLADDAKFPYKTEQILLQSYCQMKKCGMYKAECKKWMNTNEWDKTWDNSKTHFYRSLLRTKGE